jgi:predicted dehydrogenase
LERVRIGVIGCGAIGQTHVDSAAASPEIELVAIADLREDVLKSFADKHGVEAAYGEGEELLGDDRVEGVVLAMPAHVRTELGLKVLASGKHLLTEKPVAMNAGEVRQLLDAKGDLVAGCCSSRFRFLPHAEEATAFVASGALGDLRVVHCRVMRQVKGAPKPNPPPWRLKKALNGGGTLMNWGCYDLDYLMGITGWRLKPTHVLARTWQVPPAFQAHAAEGPDAETHYSALIACENGTVIQMERAEMAAAGVESAWKLTGTSGSLDMTLDVGNEKEMVFHQADGDSGVRSETLWQGDESYEQILPKCVVDFAHAIRDGHAPKTSLEQALVMQEIFDAIYASADTGEAVRIEHH